MVYRINDSFYEGTDIKLREMSFFVVSFLRITRNALHVINLMGNSLLLRVPGQFTLRASHICNNKYI